MVRPVAGAADRLFDLVAREGALLVGVGHPLRGDDAAGSVIAASLAKRFFGRAIDAGPVPESFLGPLLAVPGRPVVFLDVVAHGEAPGSWCVVPAGDLAGRPADTHRSSLGLLAGLLAAHDISVWVVGIEPRQLTPGSPLSPEVERTTAELVGLLTAALTERAHDA
jgi:hydrogenase 3 maturation protease